MIVYVPISEENKIVLEKEQFEKMIEQAKQEGYNEGFKDGSKNITAPYYNPLPNYNPLPITYYYTTGIPWWMEHKYEITC